MSLISHEATGASCICEMVVVVHNTPLVCPFFVRSKLQTHEPVVSFSRSLGNDR